MVNHNKSQFGTKGRLQSEVVGRTPSVNKVSVGVSSNTRVKDASLNARREAVILHQAMNTGILQKNPEAAPGNNPALPQGNSVQSSGNDFEVNDAFNDFEDDSSPVQPGNKKDNVGKRIRVRRSPASMSHKEMAKYVKEHEAVSNNGETSRSPFIHYDQTDKGRNFIHDRTVYGHDKLAQSKISDYAGGGASTSFSFDKKGKLNAKVHLNPYFKREDKKGFLHKSADFIDSSRKIADDFAFDDNTAAASNIDSKTEILLSHSIQKHKDKAVRYKQISKVTKKEEKILRQGIKEERKASAKKVLQTDQSPGNINDGNTHTELFVKENHFERSSPFIERGSDHVNQHVFSEDCSLGDGNDIKKKEITSTLSERGVIQKEGNKTTGNANNTSKNKTYSIEDKSSSAKSRDAVADRFMTKEEMHNQAETKRKATDKRKNKEVRRAASLAALSKAIQSKRVMQNEIGDFSGNVSGDLMKDGSSGLLSVATVGFKNAAKNLAIQAVRTVGGLAKSALIMAAPLLLLVLLICSGFYMVSSAATSVLGAIAGDGGDSGYDLDVNGNGSIYAHQPLPPETIENYIHKLWKRYPPTTDGDLNDSNAMNKDRETILRYALSKVGCEYNQDYHGNLSADIFDCSSLAYRSYREIGIDISNGGNYCAAEELHKMDNTGRSISSGNLLPGDLLFYSSSRNGRYKNVTHVAIYLGRIEINGTMVDKSVEALGVNWGVVVSDTRSATVGIGRPLKPKKHKSAN